MLDRQQVASIVKQVILKWNQEGFNSLAINRGNCDSFAQDLLNAIPDGQMFWGDEISHQFISDCDPYGHCFFFYNGLYYDSESPEGVSSPDQLAYYQRSMAVTV